MSTHQTEEEYKRGVSAVYKTTIILAVITIVEVSFALIVGAHTNNKFFVNSIYAIASIAKAFFIVGEFMHLKYEKRLFMISLGFPLIFLVWAIIAFSSEGIFWLHSNFPK